MRSLSRPQNISRKEWKNRGEDWRRDRNAAGFVDLQLSICSIPSINFRKFSVFGPSNHSSESVEEVRNANGTYSARKVWGQKKQRRAQLFWGVVRNFWSITVNVDVEKSIRVCLELLWFEVKRCWFEYLGGFHGLHLVPSPDVHRLLDAAQGVAQKRGNGGDVGGDYHGRGGCRISAISSAQMSKPYYPYLTITKCCRIPLFACNCVLFPFSYKSSIHNGYDFPYQWISH